MITVAELTTDELATAERTTGEDGLGALRTERGNLPLDTLDVKAAITGLVARTEIAQGFRNTYDEPLEATYVFPLPDRAAVTAMRMEADGRTVDAELQERGEARANYDQAIAKGQRASIAEQERPDVFTMRVGNILPGERVTVRLTLVGPLPYADGDAEYRLPLVVAPRYIPGQPLGGPQAGDGVALDTDAVPDASRITPPVLLPGFPNPVDLSIAVDVDPAGLPLAGVRSSLHATRTSEDGTITIQPGERVNRDFLLRLRYGSAAEETALAVGEDGTFQLTVLPPVAAGPPRPRDVVLVLDRSGSMHGWKMVAARRAAARIVDTLTDADRFAVMTFDHTLEYPDGLPTGLVEATDRNRYRAVEHLARVDARGGTELLTPLREAAALYRDNDRDRVLVLVTDGQVGNEDEILRALAKPLSRVRVHTIGIDQAVNAGFLGRLAAGTGELAGRCELVETEDRLDEATDRIHQRIGAPLLTGVRVEFEGAEPADLTPARLSAIFPGAPLVVRGRLTVAGAAEAAGVAATVSGTTAAGEPWQQRVTATVVGTGSLTPVWARAYLRDLEDEYAVGGGPLDDLEKRIVATSLQYGVLCRFTAFVAVDSRVVTDGAGTHRVTQPVELPAGWEPAAAIPAAAPMMAPMAMRTAAAMPPPGPAGGIGAAAQPAAADADRRLLMHSLPQAESTAAAPVLPPFAKLHRRDRGAPASTPTDAFDAVRQSLAEEAARLRAIADADEPTKRLALADLATRLDATLRQLADPGTDPRAAELRSLATDLAACDGPTPPRGPDLTALYDRALALLAAFETTETPEAPTADPGTRRSRANFWKRG